jgi:hypothetical protein
MKFLAECALESIDQLFVIAGRGQSWRGLQRGVVGPHTR